MILIPKNEYRKPTETRDEVVQMLIDAFLAGRSLTISDGSVNKVIRHDTGIPYFGIKASCNRDEVFSFHECELRKAFKLLVENGYHIFRTQNGIHMDRSEYDVRTTPWGYYRSEEVTDFSEQWE